MGRRHRYPTADPNRYLKRFVYIVGSLDLTLALYLGFSHLDTHNQMAQSANGAVTHTIPPPATPGPPVAVLSAAATPPSPTPTPTPSAELIHIPVPTPTPTRTSSHTTPPPSTTHTTTAASSAPGTHRPPTPSAVPTTTTPRTATRAAPTSNSDTLDCQDFSSQAVAQTVLKRDRNDPNHLDANRNGVACEDYPYRTPATTPTTPTTPTQLAPTTTAADTTTPTPTTSESPVAAPPPG